MKILADASLPDLKRLFPPPFKLTCYDSNAMLEEALPSHDVLVCRSTLNITPQLLDNTHILCVATASSGIDHLNTDYLARQNIPYFDAKGCNAEAVADYVLAALAYLKKHKLIRGMQAGVIGAGKVGTRVIKRLQALGFGVLVYDPFKPDLNTCSFEALKNCHLLCVHASLHNNAPYPTQNLLDTAFFDALASNTVIINAARGGIVNETALLGQKKPFTYCTDVYQNEPDINPDIVAYATLCTPHIAGHSIEAKQHAVAYLSQKLHLYFGLPPPIETMLTNTRKAAHVPLLDILNLYNPLEETHALKEATHKKAAFLALRRAHKYRHNFNWFDMNLYND